MSFIEEREHVWGLLPENVAHFLTGFENPINDASYDVIVGLLGEEFITDLVLNGYEGSDEKLIKAKTIFSADSAAIADDYRKRCMVFVMERIRLILRMETPKPSIAMDYSSKSLVELGLSPAAPVESGKLPKTSDSRENRQYPCDTCKKMALPSVYVADGISDLYYHLVTEHNEEWAKKKLALLGHEAYKTGRSFATEPSAAAKVAFGGRDLRSEFVPKYRLDLSGLPDGRYCVEDGHENWKYIRLVTIKRAYTRRGRFNWGMTTHSYQKIMPGTREVRQQSGDTKKLFGEVRDDIYWGEEEEALKLILADPVAALLLYGERMKCCAYCGRSLTDPESQARHIGPECWESKHLPFMVRELKRAAAAAEAATAASVR